ncbi:MAG TPA: HAD-IIIC family phosphatase, partial [Gemmatimonadales bacterium]|nr:HAD-IIIC family phosphatase [Gemmatimonadales bacterium]
TALAPFAGFSNLLVTTCCGDYDDSLAMVGDASDADAELFWLDYSRYEPALSGAALAEWVAARVASRRAATDHPILVAGTPGETAQDQQFNEALEERLSAIPGACFCDLRPIGRQLGPRLHDARAAHLSGTPFSDAACILSARLLGLRWIPAVLSPQLKAVVLDLDDTLYAGVLGEDGPAGVRLSAEHRALQKTLSDLAAKGVLLALASRNEFADVKELFERRSDFPLGWDAFTAAEISWDSKAAAIRRIAETLRIGTDAILFVDDNPGEVAAVAAELPGVATLHAGSDVALTVRALALFPGLWRRHATAEDRVRAADLAAASERERLAEQAADSHAYLASLQPRLTYAVNAAGHVARLHELSVKTNQFNLNLSRMTETEIARRVASADSAAVAVALTDRLTESGVIAAIFGQLSDTMVLVDELCISCRALGRRLEDALIGEAIARMVRRTHSSRIAFQYRKGPRNGPALSWLSQFTGRQLERDAGIVALDWSDETHAARMAALPILVESEVADAGR